MRRHTTTKIGVVAAIVIVLVVGLAFLFFRRQVTAPGTSNEITSTEQDNGQAPVGFNKSQHSTDAPDSLWVVVNKQRPLPMDYVPSDLVAPDVRLRLAPAQEQMKLRRAAQADLEAMFSAAARDGITLVFGSGYRSYALQKQFYDSYVARDGQAAADRYSARPGTSEHQTGLSFDATNLTQTCHLEVCFADTPEGQWLAAHAHEYGFTLRYKQAKEAVTGYQYEPWHFRYVGRALAAELHKTNQTLEEFFGLN